MDSIKHLNVPGLVVFLVFIGISSLAQNVHIDTGIMESLKKYGIAEAFLILEDQADLSYSASIRSKEEKGKYVFETLQTFNRKSQKQLVEWLEGNNYSYIPISVVNAIFAEIDENALQYLVDQPTLKAIAANPEIPLLNPVNQTASVELRNKELAAWGIEKVKANKVWELGYRGEGIVVGGQDTGYDHEHPIISKKYRGYIDSTTFDHNYNWHDAIHEIDSLHGDSIVRPENNPCGLDSPIPCDDHSHGTHTIGTMVGETDKEIYGVAPGAKWVGCRCMERGYGTPLTYLECFEWFLAPTDQMGLNPDPAKAPHVINNSWGCPPMEGCNESNFELIGQAIVNLKAAGIVVVASAGNDGRQGCGSVNDPPAMFEAAFSVGATDFEDSLAGFSSTGPVVVDGSMRLKPNISAPGVGIRSAILGDRTGSWSGTSMAGPHVAGAVALLISAVPELAGQVDEIEFLLESTAEPLFLPDSCSGISGTDIPNPFFGYGRLNVVAAVEKALSQYTHKENIQKVEDVLVFPNPTTSQIYIDLKSFQYSDIQVYNDIGQLITQEKVIPGIKLHELDTNSWGNGMFWITLIGENNTTVRLIKM